MSQPSPAESTPAAGPFRSPDARIRIGIFLAVLLICLGYAGYTQHAWEDWFITFRASKNLALGHGLTFTAGERVYSFTSPLGTTVPALCSLLAGAENDDLALWFYRLFSAAMLGAAGVLLLGLLKQAGLSRWPAATLAVALAFESKVVDHTINGMETGLMIFFLVLTLRAHAMPGPRAWLRLGLAWGGLMWSRPDGCVYGAAIALAFLLFGNGLAGLPDRRARLITYARAAAVAALVYLPWFGWAWWYYGSPVPHTITAKSLEAGQPWTAGALALKFLTLPFRSYPEYLTAAEQALTPSYARVFGGWPAPLFLYSRVVVLVSCYCWALPRVGRWTRVLSFTSLLLTFYLTDVAPYAMPWYLPNLALFVLLAFAALGHDLNRLTACVPERLRGWTPAFRLTLGCLAAAPAFTSLATFPRVAHQSRLQQQLVEDGVRTQIGRYLKENARTPKDTVMLECLGYIGFFSGLKMYDYPGMGTPEMVAARRRLTPTHGPFPGWGNLSGAQIIALVEELRPDWLVVRPDALQRILLADPEFLRRDYTGDAEISSRDQIQSVPDLPGRGFLLFDSTFFVLRRGARDSDRSAPE